MTALAVPPGAHDDLPIERYHGDCCVGPSISSTGVRVCAADPARYWDESPLNPAVERAKREAEQKRIAAGQPPRPSDRLKKFANGSAAHLLLLEPQLVDASVAVVPEGLLSADGGIRKKDALAWVADQQNAGKIVLKPEQWDNIRAMADVLRADSRVAGLLNDGICEQSHIWQDDRTGVYLKSRPDFTPNDEGRFIVDYKTTDLDSIDDWDKKMAADFRTDMQAAMQLAGVFLTRGMACPGVCYIVQNTKTRRVAIRYIHRADEFGAEMLRVARSDVRRGINTFAECWNTMTWPSPWDSERHVSPPEWRRRQITAAIEGETAPPPPDLTV